MLLVLLLQSDALERLESRDFAVREAAMRELIDREFDARGLVQRDDPEIRMRAEIIVRCVRLLRTYPGLRAAWRAAPWLLIDLSALALGRWPEVIEYEKSRDPGPFSGEVLRSLAAVILTDPEQARLWRYSWWFALEVIAAGGPGACAAASYLGNSAADLPPARVSEAAYALLKALDSPDDDTALAAARALENVASRADRATIRDLAAKAIQRLRYDGRAEAQVAVRGVVVCLTEEARSEAVASLLRLFKDRNPEVRTASVEVFWSSRIGSGRNVFLALYDALQDEDGRVRVAAALGLSARSRGLGIGEAEDSTKALLERLEDSDARVRAASAEALTVLFTCSARAGALRNHAGAIVDRLFREEKDATVLDRLKWLRDVLR